MRSRTKLLLSFALATTLAACDSTAPADGGTHPDAGPADAGARDSGPPDAGPPDAGPSDAGPATADASVPDAGPGSCTGDSDLAVQAGSTFQSDVQRCGQENLSAEPGTMSCLVDLGLTPECAGCYDGAIHCTVMHCLTPCLSDSMSAECVACRTSMCDPAFHACAGL